MSNATTPKESPMHQCFSNIVSANTHLKHVYSTVAEFASDFDTLEDFEVAFSSEMNDYLHEHSEHNLDNSTLRSALSIVRSSLSQDIPIIDEDTGVPHSKGRQQKLNKGLATTTAIKAALPLYMEHIKQVADLLNRLAPELGGVSDEVSQNRVVAVLQHFRDKLDVLENSVVATSTTINEE